jgi:hypothetical protein
MNAGAVAQGQAIANPLVIGDAGGDTFRVRVVIPVEGLRVNYAYWVTGTGVEQHIDSGAFIDISGVAQRRRMYRVGAFTYTSLQEANRVAAATGQTVIEVA